MKSYEHAGEKPYLQNFKSRNTGRLANAFQSVRGKTAPCLLAIVGDSNVAGHGCGIDGTGFVDARRYSAPVRLSLLLRARGVNAHADGIFGNSGTGGEYEYYDPRVKLGIGWKAAGAGLSGGYYLADSGDDVLQFKPELCFSDLNIAYCQAPTRGTFDLEIDGTLVDRINTKGPNALVQREWKVSAGYHCISIRHSGQRGQVGILRISPHDSWSPDFEVANLGVCGAKIDYWSMDKEPWSPFRSVSNIKPDGIIIDIGTNDIAHKSPLADFRRNYQRVISEWGKASDVILVVPVARALRGAPEEAQRAYADVIRELSAENDVPLIDLPMCFGPQEVAFQRGLHFDQTHLNQRGSALKAMAYDEALALIE
ncbi:SGNH/GDSL hydrolase family protein [Aquabacter sp. L1I39]|uniref:SGNH/GDSL hydrolase family protein n=1 Tax=Aquabacter sp. L1I39 TaxID=2820278 RepID=UPI001ADB094F|nr:SGNH/GDSL hydrolase family protein [Aquabacter sp. L1I39]QTL03942.1 SGNH/GDSL hydrolase family protein [Aquabacter sp. L1I39]